MQCYYFSMLLVRPIGPGAAPYYFRGQGPGRWLGRAAPLLDLGDAVTRQDLTAVLLGCRPGDGEYLPVRRPARRRAGWDLTFAAPKSLSLLSATVAEGSEALVDAHRRAVSDVFAHVESRHLAASRQAAPGGRVAIEGGVAAEFRHSSNAAAEPHLHSHVLVANLGVLPGTEWTALSGSDWWPARRSLAAIYQLALRHHLRAGGWDLEWRLRPDGMADLADVPRAAIRASSYQGRAAASMGRTRSRQLARPRPWHRSAARAGFRAEEATPGPITDPADRSPGPTGGRSTGDQSDPRLAELVEHRLVSDRSTFRSADVLVALAASCPDGMPVPAAEAWVNHFLGRCQAVTPVSGRPRWTTGLASDADTRLVRIASRAGPDQLRTGREGSTGAGDPGSNAENRMTAGGWLVEVLGATAGESRLLAHAALIDRCQSRWAEAALDAAVRTRMPDGPARWQSLTGLPVHRSGHRPAILVVDHADRLPTPELLALLTARIDSGLRTVLIEGGCRRRLSEASSAGFTIIGEELGRLDPGPDPDWSVGDDGSPGACRLAATRLLHAWADARADDGAAVLVGLGPDEVRGLNQGARSLLGRHGHLEGPSLNAHGRQYRSGDRVVSTGGPGSSGRRGALGLVVDVDLRRTRVSVKWDGAREPEPLGPLQLARVGHAYATSPALAARLPGRLLLLGDPASVPMLRHRIVYRTSAPPGVEAPVRHRSASPGLSL
jgi:conjugative relaxase-like TrwC/TraI family protein